MELSFKELKKREVVNVADGRSFGNLVDLYIEFPQGNLVGICVPNQKRRFPFSIFSKCDLYIDESKIIKIGNDVILVDVKCGDSCAPNVNLHSRKKRPSPPPPPCPPPCSSPCQPPYQKNSAPTVSELFNDNGDGDDY